MLFNKSKPKNGGQIALIKSDMIFPNPSQPRTSYDYDELQSLANSINENGLLQPLTVRPFACDTYELISGERRLRACKIVGLEYVPCIITSVSDEQSAVFALIENVQRADLNFFEEANAIKKLQEQYGLSQEEIAKRLGKSQSALSNKIRLLRLPNDICIDIISSGLSERHARALLKLEENEQRRKALNIILAKSLTVAETEKLIEQLVNNIPIIKKEPVGMFRDVTVFINTLNHAVDTMRKAGINANSAKNETSDYIEYVVRIPKSEKKDKAV